MIIVRNTFQLKFGKAKEAIALIKEGQNFMTNSGSGKPRFMTDLTGEFYTFIMELSFENLSAYEKSSGGTMASQEFNQWYQKFIPLVESGRREIFNVLN